MNPFRDSDPPKNVDELEELLSRPTPLVVETLSRLEGDLIILGVGGKMGPTLARMAARAIAESGSKRRVLGVSRFSDGTLPKKLSSWGIEPITCDLLNPEQVRNLPEIPNVVAMTGMKFGTSQGAALTWAMNVHVAGQVALKYRSSKIVAFSTGNVYPLSPVCRGGAREFDPVAPVGEYAITALGRERMYEHFSRTNKTPMALVRLNYANELRYGVLVDIGIKVRDELPIDLTMGNLNAIWQGDANALALCGFDHVSSPPCIYNVAGPESLSVRGIAERFSELLRRPPHFTGQERPDALISNASWSFRQFGYPRVPVDQIVVWIAHWLQAGGMLLGKPTHFETRDGQY